jgi:hypothetical protein
MSPLSDRDDPPSKPAPAAHGGRHETLAVGDATPRLSERREWLIRAFAIVTLAYTTYYIAWRWVATIHWGAWWFSIPLAVA